MVWAASEVAAGDALSAGALILPPLGSIDVTELTTAMAT